MVLESSFTAEKTMSKVFRKGKGVGLDLKGNSKTYRTSAPRRNA